MVSFKKKLFFLVSMIVSGSVFDSINGQEEKFTIPITPEIHQALIESNPSFFGNQDQPRHATCRCKLVPLESTELERFDAPIENEHWEKFLESQDSSFYESELFDKSTNTVSYHALEMFQLYLKTTVHENVSIAELIQMGGESKTASGYKSRLRLQSEKKPKKILSEEASKSVNRAQPCE